jgi:peroxiredoxin family protein
MAAPFAFCLLGQLIKFSDLSLCASLYLITCEYVDRLPASKIFHGAVRCPSRVARKRAKPIQTSLNPTGVAMSLTAELHSGPAVELAARVAALETELDAVRARVPEDKVSIVLLSGDFDKAMAAFMMATGATALGMEVNMFFTFWGCSVIKKGRKLRGKKLAHRLINLMLPASSRQLAPSKMAFGGIGRTFFNYVMRGEMASLEELIQLAVDSGVRFQVCAPSLGIMGFDADEWLVPVEVCGVAGMYDTALRARVAYFIS